MLGSLSTPPGGPQPGRNSSQRNQPQMTWAYVPEEQIQYDTTLPDDYVPTAYDNQRMAEEASTEQPSVGLTA